MSENRKVVLIITDSLGIGALPDADKYGDQNADTFGHIVRECGSLNMPNLLSLGWGNIDGVCEGKLAVESPIGCFGKMAEVSAGKDTKQVTGKSQALRQMCLSKPIRTVSLRNLWMLLRQKSALNA